MPKAISPEKQRKWESLIEQQRGSGLSIEKWCLQNQIHAYVFHYWKDKLYPKSLSRSSFTKLGSKQNGSISLECPGLYVRLGSDCSATLRKQIFNLFMGMSC